MPLFRAFLALPPSLALLGALAIPAAAQETLTGCESQQSLEQVLSSDGALMPDDCRTLTVTAVDTDRGRLCVVDLSSGRDGVLQQLRDVAVAEQWWVRCDALGQTVR
ncbi:MAG: hypothetical protein ACK4QW_03210 [Alphaproteobacteria bacterium]